MEKIRCFNLTNSVISIKLDGLDYLLYPKGTDIPEENKKDNCVMLKQHAEHPSTQAFVLCTPPKLSLVPIQRVGGVEDMQKILHQTLSEEQLKVQAFQKRVEEVLSQSESSFKMKLSTIVNEANITLNVLKEGIVDALKSVEELRKEIDNIKASVESPTPEVKNGRGRPAGSGKGQQNNSSIAGNLFNS